MENFQIENGLLIKYSGKSDRTVIPESVTAIDDMAFADCSALTEVIIPDTVTEIGNYAFYRCASLAGITIPDSVTRIGDGAFFGCSAFTEITIPESVTELGERLLADCPRVRRYTLPQAFSDTVIAVGNLLIKNSVVRRCVGEPDTVLFPENVTAIGDRAFFGCCTIKKTVIPDWITSIGDNAFYGCRRLSHIVVPDSVTSIGRTAFLGIPGNGQLQIKPCFMSMIDGYQNDDAWTAAIRGSLTRYSCGMMGEEEIAEWRQYIGKRTVKAFKLLPDEPSLYKFLTDILVLTPKRAAALIDKTERIECRAIILEYLDKRKKRKRKTDDIIDGAFIIE